MPMTIAGVNRKVREEKAMQAIESLNLTDKAFSIILATTPSFISTIMSVFLASSMLCVKTEQPQEEIETKKVDNSKPAKVEETTSAKTETAQVEAKFLIYC